MKKQYLVVSFPGTFTVLFILVLAGVHASCPERQFNNSKRCFPCPEHCIFCTSLDNCLSCDNGYSSTICQEICINCKPGSKCFKHNGYCEESCKDGLSGYYCNQACDGRCQSCLRNDSSQCITCKHNQTCTLACPNACLPRNCNGKICADDSCPDHCNSNTSDLHSNEAVVLAVPILSALIAILLFVGLGIFFSNRRRHQGFDDRHVVEYRSEHSTERRTDSHINSEITSWGFSDTYIDMYDHLERDTNACAAEPEEMIHEEQQLCEYSKPLKKARTETTESREPRDETAYTS